MSSNPKINTNRSANRNTNKSTNINIHKDEFIRRFNLHFVSSSKHNYKHHSPLKPAAVLIGLVENKTPEQGLNIILTKRASHLKHHPSQISFPGGKAETKDKNLIATALREAHEEIGLCPSAITVIGQLPSYETISGFRVTPIIGIVKSDQSFCIDENEVSEVFQVPLNHFLAEENHLSIQTTKQGEHFNIHFLPYNEYNIWGATASMLKDLVLHIR